MPPSSIQKVDVRQSTNLAELLEQLGGSLILTTYQAGQTIGIGIHHGQVAFSSCRFQQAMGMTRTPTGLALATKHEIWDLPAQKELAPHIKPTGNYDIAFMARSCHVTGPIMAHDIGWCGGQLWVVNTLCNCLSTLESAWSFVPRWSPPFITTTTPEDRCHLNGLAIEEDGSAPAVVTMHGASDHPDGWRAKKAIGGVVMEVNSGEVLQGGLAMPHSPRLHRGELYVLNSGEGQLLRINRKSGATDVVAELPGFTRGLDLIGNTAIVGLSRIRETEVFGGLPISQHHKELHCGVAFVDITSGTLQGFCWLDNGIEELFALTFLPGFRNPILTNPRSKADEKDEDSQVIWVVPPTST